MQVRLCAEHHTGTLGPHQNRKYDLRKREHQLFEREHSREEFMAIFWPQLSGGEDMKIRANSIRLIYTETGNAEVILSTASKFLNITKEKEIIAR